MYRRISVFTLFQLLILFSYGQDFDVFPRLKDDNLKIPDINSEITLEEFQILSRDIRMMDIPYSIIVPGYIHFKAKDYGTGYTILGARLLGYTGLTINAYRASQLGYRMEDIITGKDNLKSDRDLLISSSMLIIGSWLFDWIHGKYRLEKKQEMIRYKYAIKMRLQKTSFRQSNNAVIPSIGLTYKF